MAAKIMRKMALLALVETVVGTAVVPLAANAMLVSDVTLTPIEGDVVERNNIRPFFGSSGSTSCFANGSGRHRTSSHQKHCG